MKDLKVKTNIYLNRFVCRPYQLEIMDALENKGYKKILYVLPRRAGKDILAFNLTIRAALQRVASYFYIFPTYTQAKIALWDGITIGGRKFLSFIPPELVKSLNSSEMKITLTNGSIISVLGSENYDRLRGTNPAGVVFSEFSTSKPQAFTVLRPVLVANGGWFIIQGTPFGENHFYDMYQIAKDSPSWYQTLLTVDDTKHISKDEIENDIRTGIMSRDMAEQEYFCSFRTGAVGTYWAKQINNAELDGFIGDYPWEPDLLVHTAWDLGVRDYNVILFFQVIGASVRIIDCEYGPDLGIADWYRTMKQKPYNFGTHIAPHDIKVRETSDVVTRYTKALNLGLHFEIADKLPAIDGRDAVRAAFTKLRFNITNENVKHCVKGLKLYRRIYDDTKKIYAETPVKDWTTHFADALRYLVISLYKIDNNLTPDDIDKMYDDARYGRKDIPQVFK